MILKEIEVLIFDVDGTLADTERNGHRIAFNMAFADAGLDWQWTVPLYGELLRITGGKERLLHFIEHYHPSFDPPMNLTSFIAELHKSKTNHYKEILAHGKIPLRTGVRRLIEEAREQGLRLAIATTTTPINVSTLLKYSLAPDSETWFEVIASGDVVPNKKPAADIYKYTMERLSVDPEQCVAFEDSVNGVRSSLGAGIKTIVTVTDYTKDEDVNAASLVVDHLGEPDEPFQVLAGDAQDEHYVDIELIQKICSE